MIYLIALAWLACAILSAGIINADFRTEFANITRTKEDARKTLGVALGLGLWGGPVTLLVALFISGFCVHGWTLSWKPVK